MSKKTNNRNAPKVAKKQKSVKAGEKDCDAAELLEILYRLRNEHTNGSNTHSLEVTKKLNIAGA